MDRSRLYAVLAAGLSFLAAPAFAAHGKAGLWSVTSTMQTSQQIPPEAIEMMKARHMPVPNSGTPVTTQMCMTEEQVNADKPPAMSNRDESCDTRLVNQTPALVETEITCHGHMEGTGHLTIAWRGNEHYEGNYSFKGVMNGQPQEMTTRYSGDFVKSDCGSVRPMSPRPMQ